MLAELVQQLLYYFPYYVGLVLVPAVVRALIDYYVVGVRPDLFEERGAPLRILRLMSYEEAFHKIALSILYFPLFEELLFRGFPLLVLGFPGLVLASAIWVVMHPAWQLQYLSGFTFWRKLVYTLTSTGYYSANAVFYGMVWLNGHGLVAILYHMFHNGWITVVEILRNVKPRLKLPWRKPKYAVYREEEEEEWVLDTSFRFVRRSLEDEVEEVKKFMFVKESEPSEQEE